MDYFYRFFHQASQKMRGLYLAVALEPSSVLLGLSKQIREEHGFMPMDMAIPPRQKDAFHTTIAFFSSGLTDDEVNKLRQTFENREVELTITGHGKAVKDDNQALYFSLDADTVNRLRDEVRNLGLDFAKTDPHITFGVHVDTRKDAHGVPKGKQVELEPFPVKGKVKLKLGTSVIF